MDNYSYATTSPVYVSIAGKRAYSKKDAEYFEHGLTEHRSHLAIPRLEFIDGKGTRAEEAARGAIRLREFALGCISAPSVELSVAPGAFADLRLVPK